jgi:hypothetical protein
MPKIRMPDGVVVKFPDDMPDDEIRAMILSKFPDLESGATAGGPGGEDPGSEAEPMSPPEMPQPGPVAAPQPPPSDNGFMSALGNTAAFLNNMADVASFGIAPAIQRSVMNALNPGSGDALQQDINFTNQMNPLGATAGFIAGIPLGAVATGPVAAGIGNSGRIGNAFIQGGGRIGEAARVVGGGMVAGATEAAMHGEDIGTGALLGGVGGAIGGALAKPVAETVKRLAPGAQQQASRAWRYLAQKLGVSVDDIERRVTQYRAANNGRDPSVQQIVADHDAGLLSEFGSMLPHAGAELRAGARAAERGAGVTGAGGQLPGAPRFLQNVTPENASQTAMLNARDEAMDAAMDSIRNNPVSLDPDLILDINNIGALKGRKWRGVLERLNTGTATIDDIDKVRKRLVKMNSTEFSVDVEDLLDDVRAAMPAEYQDAVDAYAAASRYIEAFELARGGTARGSITDAGHRATMRSAEGDAGYAFGETLREGADRARQSAPGMLRPEGGPAGGAQFGTAAADMAVGAQISGLRQLGQGIEKAIHGLAVPPEVQREIGAAIASTDPAQVRMVLQRLREAGATEDLMNRIRVIAATAFGEKTAGVALQTGREPLEITIGGQGGGR